MTHDEMIAVIQAHKEGKKIECGNALDNVWGPWTSKVGHMNFQAFDYRIAREPRKCWVKFKDLSTPIMLTEREQKSCPPLTDKQLLEANWQLVIEEIN